MLERWIYCYLIDKIGSNTACRCALYLRLLRRRFALEEAFFFSAAVFLFLDFFGGSSSSSSSSSMFSSSSSDFFFLGSSSPRICSYEVLTRLRIFDLDAFCSLDIDFNLFLRSEIVLSLSLICFLSFKRWSSLALRAAASLSFIFSIFSLDFSFISLNFSLNFSPRASFFFFAEVSSFFSFLVVFLVVEAAAFLASSICWRISDVSTSSSRYITKLASPSSSSHGFPDLGCFILS
mmetsp:Transcript_46089/g.74124  ORF Transcript_46089/g.74124 Transcript_46089/m.74124 type:complete len:235 (+) Transcript_46089:200-904(+)